VKQKNYSSSGVLRNTRRSCPLAETGARGESWGRKISTYNMGRISRYPKVKKKKKAR
jgi:hypothetical protein